MHTSGFPAPLLAGKRRLVKSPIITTLAACTILFGQSAAVSRADQTISTAVTGPVFGNNAGIDITINGSVTNAVGGAALQTNASDTITTLSNAGAVNGYSQGLLNDGNSITSIANTNTIVGGAVGIQSSGTIGSLHNAALGSITGAGSVGILNLSGGLITSLNNEHIVNGYARGIQNNDGAMIGQLDNSGTVSGLWGVNNAGTIGAFSNTSGGTLDAGDYGFVVGGTGASVGTLINGGTIKSGGGQGLNVSSGASVTTLSNLAGGLIQGGYNFGLLVDSNGGAAAIGTVSNAGTITGPDRGIYLSGASASIATLTNSGTTSGGQVGITVDSGTIGSLTNSAGGLIAGSAYHGLQNYFGAVTSLDNAGTIQGGDRGVSNNGTMTTATNSGAITGGAVGLEQAGGTLGSLVNSGTIQGSAYHGVFVTSGTLTSLGNSGDILGGWIGVRNENQTIGTITNDATGTIQGSAYDGIQNVGGSITTIDNSGVVNGVGRTGIRNDEYYGNAHIGTIINRAGASVSGADFGIGNMNNFTGSTATIDSITNAGDILGNQMGVHNEGNQTIGTITNGATGTIQGTVYDGIQNVGGTITSIDNSGVINGVGRSGIRNEDYLGFAHIGTITNRAGSSISGTDFGIANFQAYGYTATIDSIDNAGSVYGVSVGVYNLAGTIPALVNSGTISGISAAVYNGGGSIGSLDNSGTIGNATINYGGIESITNTGVFGDLGNSGFIGTGTGTAISSTGGGASLGAIYNAGTINGSVTVANQDLLVHGGSSPQFGVFENGTINVQNGSLTLVDGSTYLDSDVIVSSLAGTAGQGTMTNQGELILGAARQLDGSFVQTSSGSFTAALFDLSTYGSLAITGTATFDGVLNFEEDGIALADGQTFNLFSFTTVVGDFSSLAVNGVLLTPLGGGSWAYGSLILTEILSGSSLSLSVTATAVPEIDPASFGAALSLLLGSLSLLERRRRRIKATVAG